MIQLRNRSKGSPAGTRRLAVVSSHPIQYYAPLYRELAKQTELKVYYAHRATPTDQANAGFGVSFEWDSDLYSGYCFDFLENVSLQPSTERFSGCDTPGVLASLRDFRPHAVLVQGWYLKSFLQAMFAAKQLGCRLLARGDSVLSTPRRMPIRILKRVVYPSFLRLFDAALFVGARSREYWLHYGYPAHRLFFSPHCVDTEWFRSRATNDARNALRQRIGVDSTLKLTLIAGKLVEGKRPIDVISAVSLVRQRGIDMAVLVAGDGPLRSEVIRAARDNRVPLFMLGFCNQSKMPFAYAACDVMVLASTETWGLVANEALASRRPVILSDAVGAAPDLASDGHAGRTFRFGDVQSLASKLVEVVQNPPSGDGIERLSERYSVGCAARGIYKALVGEHIDRSESIAL